MAIDSLVSARISKNAPSRYAAALLATVLALLARWALNPFLGDRGLYLTLFPAVVFPALYCGIGPSMASILVVVLALAGATYCSSRLHTRFASLARNNSLWSLHSC